MNRHFLSKLKERLRPALARHTGKGTLGGAQHEALFALFQVIAGDEGFPPERVRQHIDERTLTTAGYLREYEAGIALVEAAAAQAFPGRAFHRLSLAERDAVLRAILRRYPGPPREPAWRRRLKLTSENLDAILGERRARRLRLYVIRDLLGFYYTTASGWAVVGYQAFPGRSRAELEPCEVRSIAVEGDRMILALSDGSFEAVEPRTVRAEGEGVLSATIKSGRQKASFSRSASLALGEHLEDTGGGLYLRVGDRAYEVLR
jgi:hypothetical protein